MYNDNYVPQNLKSKSDISLYLSKNIDSYKEEAKMILDNSDFSESQKEDIIDIMRQYYYSLNDLCTAINILNK